MINWPSVWSTWAIKQLIWYRLNKNKTCLRLCWKAMSKTYFVSDRVIAFSSKLTLNAFKLYNEKQHIEKLYRSQYKYNFCYGLLGFAFSETSDLCLWHKNMYFVHCRSYIKYCCCTKKGWPLIKIEFVLLQKFLFVIMQTETNKISQLKLCNLLHVKRFYMFVNCIYL